MLRRLHANQPEGFAFTPANQAWAEAQISKYPEGREASAIIPLLWRAQEQEGWLTKPAIETVADMLGLAYIRALEVASFYFMFQLQPVGSIANIQICGTTTCMICGSENLMRVCKEKIAPNPHTVSSDGKFSWEEVECLGACANAPMAQIGKDYYEDLTAERLGEIIDQLSVGEVPKPGPQTGRFSSEPEGGLTSLSAHESGRSESNASVELANRHNDGVKRIDGSEIPLTAPWPAQGASSKLRGPPAWQPADNAAAREPIKERTGSPNEPTPGAAGSASPVVQSTITTATTPTAEVSPTSEGQGGSDDLTLISGIGPKLSSLLQENGVTTFAQIADWGPEEIDWADNKLAKFKGRCTRDNWVGQAKILNSGGETEFSRRQKED